MLENNYVSFFEIFRKFKICRFGWGALPPKPPGFWLGGQSPPRPPPERPYLAFDRGGQAGPPRSNAFFFGAADDTGVADDRPRQPFAGRLPAGRNNSESRLTLPARNTGFVFGSFREPSENSENPVTLT